MVRNEDGTGTCVECGTELYPYDETYPSDRCKECFEKLYGKSFFVAWKHMEE